MYYIAAFYLSIFSDIWSSIKELYELWVEFFENIGDFLSFLGGTIMDWFKFGHILTTAIQYLPDVFGFLPDILVPFASGCLILSVILLVLGRN